MILIDLLLELYLKKFRLVNESNALNRVLF